MMQAKRKKWAKAYGENCDMQKKRNKRKNFENFRISFAIAIRFRTKFGMTHGFKIFVISVLGFS